MVLILPLEVLYKIGVLKNFAVFTDSQENTCTRVFVMLQLYWKKTLVQGFSCQFCKIFKNRFGWLLIFYNSYWLYFAIIYSWQLSVSKKSLGIQISFFHFFKFFFHFLWQVPVYLLSYARPLLYSYSEQSTILLAQRHLSTMIFTNLKNFNSISNIFQKTHDLLVLRDAVIICIYSRTTDRHFCD